MKKLAALFLLLSTSMSHATIVDVTAPSALNLNGDIIIYSPSPADTVWFSNDGNADFNPQNAAHIETVIEGLYGSNIFFEEEIDNLSGSDYTHTGDAFHFIAIHYGDHELVFHYEAAIDDFMISGLDWDVSNVRTYSTTPNPNPGEVPIPAAAWLFGSGLLGLGAVGRKRKTI